MHFINTINTVATQTISTVLQAKTISPQDMAYNSLCQV